MRHRQQSLQQQHQDDGQGHGGQHGVSNGNFQQPRLTASALARMQQFQQQQNHSVVEPSSNITSSSTTRSLYDVKAMQKEAVLSYVKSKQTSPSRSVAGRGSQPDLQTTSSSRNNGLANGRAASTTSIPQPSPNGRLATDGSSIISNNKPTLGKLKMASFDHQSSNGGGPTHRGHQYTARRDVEKSATADAHISQLRLEIESRLRITLPEDISIALADGVILCHIANHVKPRAVPSIHVPSPSVVSCCFDLFSMYIFIFPSNQFERKFS